MALVFRGLPARLTGLDMRGCTCRVMVSSGYAGTQSSPRLGLRALEDRCHHSGTHAAAASWWASEPLQGPHPAPALGPPAGWAPAETACTALKSSWGRKGQLQVRTTPPPAAASPAPLPAVSEAHFQEESSPNSLTTKDVCLATGHSSRPRFKSQCCPCVSWANYSECPFPHLRNGDNSTNLIPCCGDLNNNTGESLSTEIQKLLFGDQIQPLPFLF